MSRRQDIIFGVWFLAVPVCFALGWYSRSWEITEFRRRVENAEALRERLGERLQEIGADKRRLSLRLRSSGHRTTGHLLPRFPEIVGGSAHEANSRAYLWPATWSSSKLHAGFSCSGVIGTRQARKEEAFGQWVLNRPTTGRGRFRSCHLHVSGAHMTGRKSIPVGALSNVITAEICWATESAKGGRLISWQHYLWLSPGNRIDGRRILVPLGTLEHHRQRLVIENAVPEERDITDPGDLVLFRVLRKESADAPDGEELARVTVEFVR